MSIKRLFSLEWTLKCGVSLHKTENIPHQSQFLVLVPLVDSPGSRGEIGWNNAISDKRTFFFLNDQYIEQQIPISTQAKNKPKSLSNLHSHLSTHPPTHTRQNIDILHANLSCTPKGQILTEERLSPINGEKTDLVVMNWHRKKPFAVM